MFYTFVDRIGNRIFHRFFSSETKQRQNEVIRELPLELFIKSENGSDTSLFGDRLAKFEFSNIKDMKEFSDEYSKITEVFGQTEAAYQFIANNYPGEIKFDMDHIEVLNFDIEVISDTGFPTPEKAEHPISSITLKVLKRGEFISFGYGDFKPPENSQYTKCADEKELLLRFIATWSRISPDILTGWNINGFDIPYCVNRIRMVLGEEYVNKLSPFSKQVKDAVQSIKLQGDDTGYKILGITTLDYLELYKKYSYKNVEKYSLDHIAGLELNTGKVDYKEYGNLQNLFQQNHQLFMEYNLKDVDLVEQLDEKLNFIFLAVTLAFIGKIRLHEIFGSVRFWDNYIYNSLLSKKIQIPPTKHKSSESGIKGAFVKEPIPGLYKWIISFDLTSLYPSIIMGNNMSPETTVSSATGNHVEDMIDLSLNTTEALIKNVSIAANGALFAREKKGIMPELVNHMFKQRKAHKNHMLQAKKELEVLKDKGLDQTEKKKEIATYDAMQMAFKIALNSLYGAQANEFFRYYSQDIAEGITLTGQLIIRFIMKRINIFLNDELKTSDVDYVIAGDTDSIFITLDALVNKVGAGKDKEKTIDFLDKVAQKKLEPFIAKQFAELANYLNLFENKLHMKREKLSDAGIWRAKKNYIIQVYDNEGVRYTVPKISTVGVETSRSSSPEIVKTALKECYKFLLNQNLDELRAFETSFRKEFFNASVERISFPRGISDIDKWKVSEDSFDWKTGAPIHVKAALSYNKLLVDSKLNKRMPLIKNGDKIKFIALKVPNPVHNNAIAFFDTIPKKFGLDKYIDKELQYEKTFINPLESFLTLVNWELKERNTLESLFG